MKIITSNSLLNYCKVSRAYGRILIPAYPGLKKILIKKKYLDELSSGKMDRHSNVELVILVLVTMNQGLVEIKYDSLFA